jgi:hypothetical protein
MGSGDNINSRQKEKDDTIKDLHILLFLIHFFLVIVMILLTAMGIGSSCCTWILIILLLTNILFFWHRRRIYRIKKEKFLEQTRVNLEIVNLPKVYDFYCPKCLYQTNEHVEFCPNCQTGRLSPTTKNLN